MPKHSSSVHYELMAAKEEIKRLRENLWEARRNLIGLIPHELSSILLSYYSCSNRREADSWWADIRQQIISRAKILSGAEGSYFEKRAYCPLCGEGSSGPYDTGFSHPEGLRRHLDGYGNVRQCRVMKAAWDLALENWNKQFAEKEEQEREEELMKETERRKTETLYVLRLGGEPQLIDKTSIYSPPRDEAQLLWAEARLLELEFRTLVEENVKSYTKEYGDYIVYADPLTLGRIDFGLYKKNPGKGARRKLRNWPAGHYSIQDKWKNNLPAKLELFVSNTIKTIDQKEKSATKAVR